MEWVIVFIIDWFFAMVKYVFGLKEQVMSLDPKQMIFLLIFLTMLSIDFKFADFLNKVENRQLYYKPNQP